MAKYRIKCIYIHELKGGDSMANILIVEDDYRQRENLIKMISELGENINIYEAECKEGAIRILKEIPIDFFYIDISLKDSSGLDLALDIRNIEEYKFTWIVFITTHSSYIIQAFKEVHCYDYIIKPYDKDVIINMTKLLLSGNYVSNFSKEEDKRIIFEMDKGINIKINVNEIMFIEVNLRIMTIYTKDRNYTVKKLALNKVLNMIHSENIIQSHKSFAINMDYVERIESVSGKLWKIGFVDFGEKALLSYSFKDVVMERFRRNE